MVVHDPIQLQSVRRNANLGALLHLIEDNMSKRSSTSKIRFTKHDVFSPDLEDISHGATASSSIRAELHNRLVEQLE